MIDVIIPVYRPDDKLERLVEKLAVQTIQPTHVYFMQTLVDEKEDERVKNILERLPNGQIVPIEKKDFDHGGTRNLGASLSKEPYMLFMTQDAVPENEYLIEKIVKPFSDDEKIAAVYGRQLPSEEVGVIEHYTRQFNYPDNDSVKSKEDLERLGIKTYFCSNVCAAYKNEIYRNLGGFVTKTIFNEDMIMASKIIDAGYKIAYASGAKVIHAHKYTYRQQLTRNFDMAVSQRQYREIFERVKSESEGIKLVKQTAKYLLSCGKGYLLFDLVLQSGFKLIGYKLGLKYEKLPMWLVKKCSMNKAYWKETKNGK